MSDFANYPKSIGELRADKTENGAEWSPRDALISMLRQIDDGNIAPTAIVICWQSEGICNYENASPSVIVATGILARCMHRLNRNADAE